LENYFCAIQKRLLLRNSHLKRPGFAIGILKDFGKGITNTWNIWMVINKAIHGTVAIMRNRT
jgi:hypothetical protein